MRVRGECECEGEGEGEGEGWGVLSWYLCLSVFVSLSILLCADGLCYIAVFVRYLLDDRCLFRLGLGLGLELGLGLGLDPVCLVSLSKDTGWS